VNLVCLEGGSSEDGRSIEFEIMATKEQEGEKEVDTGDTIAPIGTAGCKMIGIYVQNKCLVLIMSGRLLLRLWIEGSVWGAQSRRLLGIGQFPDQVRYYIMSSSWTAFYLVIECTHSSGHLLNHLLSRSTTNSRAGNLLLSWT